MAGTGLSTAIFSQPLDWRLLPISPIERGNYGSSCPRFLSWVIRSDLGLNSKALFMARQGRDWMLDCFFLYRADFEINRWVLELQAPETLSLGWMIVKNPKYRFPWSPDGHYQYFSWWLFPLHCVLSVFRWSGFICCGCIFLLDCRVKYHAPILGRSKGSNVCTCAEWKHNMWIA